MIHLHEVYTPICNRLRIDVPMTCDTLCMQWCAVCIVHVCTCAVCIINAAHVSILHHTTCASLSNCTILHDVIAMREYSPNDPGRFPLHVSVPTHVYRPKYSPFAWTYEMTASRPCGNFFGSACKWPVALRDARDQQSSKFTYLYLQQQQHTKINQKINRQM